jgi:hypothetical protein
MPKLPTIFQKNQQLKKIKLCRSHPCTYGIFQMYINLLNSQLELVVKRDFFFCHFLEEGPKAERPY